MPTKLLMETYRKALRYKLDHTFIDLLVEEIIRRDILTNVSYSYKIKNRV